MDHKKHQVVICSFHLFIAYNLKKTKEIEIIHYRKIHTVGNKIYQATIPLPFSFQIKGMYNVHQRLRDAKSGELGKPVCANFFPLRAK